MTRRIDYSIANNRAHSDHPGVKARSRAERDLLRTDPMGLISQTVCTGFKRHVLRDPTGFRK
jgi:hypothetical protein